MPNLVADSGTRPHEFLELSNSALLGGRIRGMRLRPDRQSDDLEDDDIPF